MEVEQVQWDGTRGFNARPGRLDGAQLVLVFGDAGLLAEGRVVRELRQAWPKAWLVGCSTAGEICDTTVADGTVVATAVWFEHSRIAGSSMQVAEAGGSFAAGAVLADALTAPDLRHVLVFSDGLCVNGSELVRGLCGHLPDGVTVTGGLSADGGRFQRTFVLSGQETSTGNVAAVGLYGEALRIGCASLGGWDQFGPERVVTSAEGNVLCEVDGRPALQLYERYLGDAARDLPASGLLFPLMVRVPGQDESVVRSVLAVDRARGSMTFAGDVPQGARVRLMRGNCDRLVEGAAGAARAASVAGLAQLALLISCFGRKMVLRQRVEEETEAVREVLGHGPTLAGFYSYAEIAPFTTSGRCELHNQSMTVTTLSEVEA